MRSRFRYAAEISFRESRSEMAPDGAIFVLHFPPSATLADGSVARVRRPILCR